MTDVNKSIPEHDPRRRFCNTANKCPQYRELEAEVERLREALAQVTCTDTWMKAQMVATQALRPGRDAG